MPPKRKTPSTKVTKPVDETGSDIGEPKKARGAKKVEDNGVNVPGTNGDAKPKRAGRANRPDAKASPKSDEISEEKAEVVPVEKKGRGRKAKAPAELAEQKEIEEKPEAPEKKPRGRKAKPAEVVEDEPKEKKSRARKTVAPKAEDDDEAEEKPKKSRAKKAPAPKGESAAKGPMNPTETFYDEIDFSCDKENLLGEKPNFVIASWNVDGLRAWLKKDGLRYLEYEKPDVFCVQETKCGTDKLPGEVTELKGYHQYWKNSVQEGYAGVGLFSRQEPISLKYGIGVDEHDEDGRCITAEFEKFYVISVYVPNAGRGLATLSKRLEWNKAFKSYIKKLDQIKPVIICGDMNVAHNEIDLANPKPNVKNAGFTKEEREGMTTFLSDGYVDTYRKFYPEKAGAYTFWTYMMKSRSKNVGWRLDYFLVSDRLVDNICDNVIRSDVLGSDHCPIALFLNI